MYGEAHGMRMLGVKYSGLNLNQDKAMKPQTVQIVRQGEAKPYWFKFNPLYHCLSRFDAVYFKKVV